MVLQIAYKPMSQGFITFEIPSSGFVFDVSLHNDYIEFYYGINKGYDKDDKVKHKFYGAKLGDEISPLVKIDKAITSKDSYILFSVL